MQKAGVRLTELFASEVFSVTFDYDEWPGNHNDPSECIRPYNNSIFMVRQSYSDVFPEPQFLPMDDQSEEAIELSKVYKIKYSINLLPQISSFKKESATSSLNSDKSPIITLAADSEEDGIFDTESLL